MIGCHGIDDPDEPVLAVQLQRTKPCTQLNVDRSVGLKKKKKKEEEFIQWGVGHTFSRPFRSLSAKPLEMLSVNTVLWKQLAANLCSP